jgi:hypothetical protein
MALGDWPQEEQIYVVQTFLEVLPTLDHFDHLAGNKRCRRSQHRHWGSGAKKSKFPGFKRLFDLPELKPSIS